MYAIFKFLPNFLIIIIVWRIPKILHLVYISLKRSYNLQYKMSTDFMLIKMWVSLLVVIHHRILELFLFWSVPY